MLALYPIFNFKGFKYNPDLLQLVTLPLLVLAYLHAFEKRSVRSGLWLGLAGALALMTKYWVLTMIGAIGLAALLHPDRLQFLRSPAPWVAIATLVAVMLPHLVWLREVDFVPLTYAGDVYTHFDPRPEHATRARLHRPQYGAAGAAGRAGVGWRWPGPSAGAATVGAVLAHMVARRQSGREPVAGAQCLDHPGRSSRSARCSAALVFTIYMKTDWGISLFFLTPLALVAIPALRIRSDRAVSYRRDLARDHAGRCWPRRPTSPHVRWR